MIANLRGETYWIQSPYLGSVKICAISKKKIIYALDSRILHIVGL